MKQMNYSTHEKKIWKIFFIIFMLALIASALSGCAITNEKPKCELMLRGEPCLIDHRCCDTYRVYQPRNNWNWWYWNKPIHTKTIIIKDNSHNKPNRPDKPNRPNRKPKNKKR